MTIHLSFVDRAIVPPPLILPHREVGACAEFQGIVREREGAASVAGLHYEAHQSMAVKLLNRHFRNLAETHPVVAVEFIHRLGWVPVGEVSLFLRVTSVHRAEALHFLAQSIDLLKKDVPIWKRREAEKGAAPP